MRKPDADRFFISTYYGDADSFRLAVQSDYCKAQFEWSCFIDSLSKSGEISNRQYETWAFPGNKYKKNATKASD